jgi:hypothetical protein
MTMKNAVLWYVNAVWLLCGFQIFGSFTDVAIFYELSCGIIFFKARHLGNMVNIPIEISLK